VSRRALGLAALAALGVAAAVVIAFELRAGALDYGERVERDPCTARVDLPGEGFDATLQRIVLDGLDGAACELGSTREELVLSFDADLAGDVRRDRESLERAVRSGLLEAVDRAEERGEVGRIQALILREAVRRAPIDWLLDESGLSLGDVLEGLG
jgi:hypothetical protein